MTALERTIKASLAYIGRSVPWLAKNLGLSTSGCYVKLHADRWEYAELKRMQEIFRWKTLEG